jgi:hypothetical protein
MIARMFTVSFPMRPTISPHISRCTCTLTTVLPGTASRYTS